MTATSSRRAARCWADRARSTGSSTFAARRRISITGGSLATPAGAPTMCCRTSARPRATSAARMNGTAATGRLACPICATPIRWPLAYVEAAAECGYPRNGDFNGAQQEGAGFYQTTTRGGVRSSTAVAYLDPARSRGNLKVVSEALATRILFEGRRAVGVEYTVGGEKRTARANVEVIVASGAFNSPQLLQLSGLGPASLLSPLGIAVIADMPGRRRRPQRPLFRPAHSALQGAAVAQRRGAAMAPRRGRRAALRAVPARLFCDPGAVGGLLSPRAAVVGDAGHPGFARALFGAEHRRKAAPVLRRHRCVHAAAAGKPRLRSHQVGRSARGAGDPSELSRRRNATATRWWRA